MPVQTQGWKILSVCVDDVVKKIFVFVHRHVQKTWQGARLYKAVTKKMSKCLKTISLKNKTSKQLRWQMT